MSSTAQILAKQLKNLTGATLLGTVVEKDEFDGEDYLALVLSKEGENKIIYLWVQSDEEGNGPGFLSIQK